MNKIRFLNMPVPIWVLGALIAYLLLLNVPPGFLLAAGVVFILLLTWFCWDTIVPTFGNREFVWFCRICSNVDVIIVPDSVADDAVKNYVKYRLPAEHYWAFYPETYKLCKTDSSEIDLYFDFGKLTQLPAKIQIRVWQRLLVQRSISKVMKPDD